MSLTDRERGIAAAFGAARRRYERWTTLLLFVVSLISGLFGAYLGVGAVLELFSAVAIVIIINIAIIWARRTFSDKNNA